jgi:hypothetical protein
MASLNMDFPPISPTILQKHLEDGAAMWRRPRIKFWVLSEGKE